MVVRVAPSRIFSSEADAVTSMMSAALIVTVLSAAEIVLLVSVSTPVFVASAEVSEIPCTLVVSEEWVLT